MTQPALAKRGGGYDAPRIYSWPPHPPHEFEVMSVTSVLNKGYPKPWLIGWAAKVTAETAVDKYKLLGDLIEGDGVRGATEWLKRSRYNDTAEKADRGTIVHAALEAYLAGKPFTKAQLEERLEEARLPKEMWRSTAGMIAGLMEFLFDKEPEVVHSEATVFNRTHGYAGTADVLGYMTLGGPEKRPIVLDVKTSKSIYDDVGLQLAAYARGEFIGHADGTEETPILEGDPIRDGVVVRPTASGSYEAAAFTLTDELFDTFLGCLAVANGLEAIRTARRPSF